MCQPYTMTRCEISPQYPLRHILQRASGSQGTSRDSLDVFFPLLSSGYLIISQGKGDYGAQTKGA